MTNLRRLHPRLFTTLELVVDELLMRFRPSLEEELLGAVNALFERVDQLGGGEVPAPLKKAFTGVSERFFFAASAKGKRGGSGGAEDGGEAEVRERFNDLYHQPFADHFLCAKLPVSSAKMNLRLWSESLGKTIAKTPRKIALSDVSPRLAGMNFLPCDLWPSTDSPVDPTDASSSTRADTTALAYQAAQQAVAAHEEIKGGGSCKDDGLLNIPDALAAPTQAPRMEVSTSKRASKEQNDELRRRVMSSLKSFLTPPIKLTILLALLVTARAEAAEVRFNVRGRGARGRAAEEGWDGRV